MDQSQHQIHRLPPEIQRQIKSTVAILSLNDVVLELAKNALDAEAKKIEIQLDYFKGYCRVLDNGLGIPAQEFEEGGRLAQMYSTSKSASDSQSYGRHGRFLAHLSSMSLLSISSKQSWEQNSSIIILNKSGVVARSKVDSGMQGEIPYQHGTVVTVRSLFGNMPVRLHHLATRFSTAGGVERDFRMLKKRLVALELTASKSFSVKVIEDRANQKYASRAVETRSLCDARTQSFHLKSICSILAKAGYIDYIDSLNWRTASARTTSTLIRAAISLTPAPSKHVQFVSIGKKPVHSEHSAAILLEEINIAFEQSSFGTCENNTGVAGEENLQRLNDGHYKRDDHTHRQLQSPRKGVDRYPMFYIRIDIDDQHAGADHIFDSSTSGRCLVGVLEVLLSLIHQFLAVHRFRPKARRKANAESSRAGNKSVRTVQLPLAGPKSGSISRDGAQNEQGFEQWSRTKAGSNDSRVLKASGSTEKVDSDNLQESPKAAFGQEDAPVLIHIGEQAIQTAQDVATLDANFDLLLQSLSYNEEETRALSFETASPYFASQAEHSTAHQSHPDIALWTDPRTGKTACFNPRTGLNALSQSSSTIDSSDTSRLENEVIQHVKVIQRSKLGIRVRKSTAFHAPTTISGRWNVFDAHQQFPFRQREPPVPSRVRYEEDQIQEYCDPRKPPSGCIPAAKRLESLFVQSEDEGIVEHRLSKAALQHAEVIAQVDRKFVLAQVALETAQKGFRPATDAPDCDKMLVLIDQHAADERIRVEALFEQLCNNELIILQPPIVFEISEIEMERFASRTEFLESWGFSCQLQSPAKDKAMPGNNDSNSNSHIVAVSSLPNVIAERCRADPKILIELLRAEAWRDTREIPQEAAQNPLDWLSRLSNCPLGLVHMVNSRACRTAIMFNDLLSLQQCQELVRNLANCQMPFQCAHGRPSMIALTALSERLGKEGGQDEKDFGGSLRDWMAGA